MREEFVDPAVELGKIACARDPPGTEEPRVDAIIALMQRLTVTAISVVGGV